MKKLFALPLLMLVLVVLMAACSSGVSSTSTSKTTEGSDTNEESKEKQVVTFWHSMGGAGQEALNDIVESYNSSQDEIQVNAEYQGT
jgi:sn-glycerol 3-phosphate transport system substrate-binding protein